MIIVEFESHTLHVFQVGGKIVMLISARKYFALAFL